MTVDQLKDSLNAKYSIKGIIDLAELSQSPGAAYQFFNDLYQSEFAVDDRIILYTSYKIPEDFLAHLYQTTNFIDVSNWFVLICTPTDVSEQFKSLAAKYSHDPVPFQNFQVEIQQTKVFKNEYCLPDTICPVPWMHLEIKNDGSISPCCMTKNITVGNIDTDTLDQAFHSEYIQKLRNQLLAGEKPKECDRCWRSEDRGVSSGRTYNLKRLKKEFLLKYLETPTITSLDIKFNNTCNFKCRICNPVSSSLIASESKKFLNISITPQSKWSESDNFINQMFEKLPELTNIDMFGGEPFLIKKFSRVLKMAIEQGYAKNIRLHYNTNGSVWPDAFVTYWPYFKEVDIHFSIDAIGPRFELQRGGSWTEVEKNILKIKNLNLPNMTLNLMSTVSVMNVYYLDEVYDWAQTHKFPLFVSSLYHPSEFSLKNLTKQAQDLIIKKFQNHAWVDIQNIIKDIQNTPASDGKEFCKKIAWFDSIRQENFSKSHNEIAEAMGYVYNKTI